MLSVCLLWLAMSPGEPEILSMRDRAALWDQHLEVRLNKVVPALMAREGVDCWVLIAREYNEDPVVETMLPSTWLAARRRTILVFFHKPDGTVERLAIARYNIGSFFLKAWAPKQQPDQLARLAQLIKERKSQKIAINIDPVFALADGLTHTEHEGLVKALGPELSKRLVPARNLALGWLETRTAEEMAFYPKVNRVAHSIIAEAFSSRIIEPGKTTTDDVVWFMRERVRELKLKVWFHPTVSIQRAKDQEHQGDFSGKDASKVIQRGDLLHTDFGITYVGLNTDTQRMAYVLKEGETEAPKGLVDAFRAGNRLQDILTGNYKTTHTGNEVLALSLSQAKAEGLEPTIYTHPIGLHGHGAGATIGLWDQQGGVPVRGDYPVNGHTAWAIELNTAVTVPEWGRKIRIMLEEDAYFDGKEVRYIDGRQEALFLIR